MKLSPQPWLLPALLIVMTAVVPACSTPNAVLERPARRPIRSLETDGGVVVSETVEASRIGADVLARGGTAVDAAVAVAFALAVTWPEAGNVAGGGFMMAAPPDDADVWCVDYRETAPAAAHERMFVDDRSRFHRLQVGVPGTVRGLALAHQRWGKLPWRELVEPAATLARDGFEVDEYLAFSINTVLSADNVRTDPAFAELRRVYGRPDGGLWQAGDRLRLPDLARTLDIIAADGPEAFYAGRLADALARDMAERGGIITKDDLAGYRAVLRPAVRFEFAGHHVFGPPPPSAGGLVLAMTLQQLDSVSLTDHPRYSADALHLIAEATRRAYHQRVLHLGDGDYVEIPPHLSTPEHARRLASTISPLHATPSASLEPAVPIADESPDTTHFSIVDADGFAVSNTYTLEMSWGSRLIVPGTGMILNNEMGDFNPEPDVTRRNGQVGTAPNRIAPGKRMLSAQTPTIAKADGRVVLVTGSPGGRSITNTVAGILISRLAYGQAPAECVNGVRLHHQWLPDRILLEAADDPQYRAVVSRLRAMGHVVEAPSMPQGSAHTIAIDPTNGRRTAVIDRRRGGGAADDGGRSANYRDSSAPQAP